MYIDLILLFDKPAVGTLLKLLDTNGFGRGQANGLHELRVILKREDLAGLHRVVIIDDAVGASAVSPEHIRVDEAG